MARIPIYNQPQIQQAPIAGGRAPEAGDLAAYGGGQGVAEVFGQARGLAGDAAKMAQESYRDTLNLQLAELTAKLSDEETRQKVHLQGVKGKDALKASDDVLNNFDGFYKKVDEGIGNSELRDKFRMAYLQHKQSLNGYAQPYAADQMRNYSNEVTQSVITTEQRAVEQDASKERILLSIMRQNAALEDFAKRNGQSPEWLDAQQKEHESATHMKVLNLMLDSGQDMAAKNYFTANSGLLTGRDLEVATKRIEDGSYRGEAQRGVDKIFSTYYTETTRDGETSIDRHDPPDTLQAARDEAVKLAGNDEKLRDHLVERVEHEWAVRKRSAFEAHSQLLDDAVNALYQHNGDVTKLPQSMMDELKGKEKAELLFLGRRIQTKEEPVTDLERWTALRNMASDEDTRQKFIDLNPLLYKNYLSKADYEKMVDLRDKLKAGGGEDRVRLWQSIDRMINQRKSGLSDAKKAQLTQVLEEDIDAFHKEKKRMPQSYEIAPRLDALLKDEHWWSPYEFSKIEEERQKVEAIPAEERADIIRKLEAAGMSTSRENIARWYHKKHGYSPGSAPSTTPQQFNPWLYQNYGH